MEEVSKHCTRDDAWMVLNGLVYNATPYLKFHPGGVNELMRGVGKDGTKLFQEAHRWVTPMTMLSVSGHNKASRLQLTGAVEVYCWAVSTRDEEGCLQL